MATVSLGFKLSVTLLPLMTFACMSAQALWIVYDGEMRPPTGSKINYLTEGQKLEIECTLTNETWKRTCNASDMSIRLFKRPGDGNYHLVGDQTPTGEFSISLVIERATTNVSGTYYCCCGEEKLFFLIVKFSVQAPPEEPVVQQILLDNLENLTVTFDPVRNDSSLNVNTTWTLHLFSSNRTEGSSVVCSEKEQQKFSCKYEDLGSFGTLPTRVEIHAENERGNNSATWPSNRLWDYVRPRPVGAVEVEVRSSTGVRLEWNRTEGLETFQFGGLVYQMTFTSQLYTPHVVNFTCHAENETAEEGCKRLVEEVSGLQPYTNYSLSLLSHPVVGGYWSEPTVIAFETSEDVPRLGPGMQPWRYTSVETADGTYRTFIYPQGLREEDKAGKIRLYELAYVGEGGWEEPQRVPGTPLSIELLPFHHQAPLTLRLWAHTAVGRSLNYSTFHLPPSSAGVARPGWLDVEVVNASFYRLFWEALDLQPSTSVQLHWCWGEVQHYSQSSLVFCKTELGSRSVDSHATSAWFESQEEGRHCADRTHCSLHFGISVQSGGLSSGIVWNTCLFRSDQVAARLSDLHIHGSPGHLAVSWLYPCHISIHSEEGRPVMFESRYSLRASQSATSACDEAEGTNQSTEARHGENRLEWSDLQAGSYLICVRSIPKPPSFIGPWTVKVHQLDSDIFWLLPIVVGLSGVAAVIVIVITVRFALRWKLRSGRLDITTLDEVGVEATYDPNIANEYVPPVGPHTSLDAAPAAACPQQESGGAPQAKNEVCPREARIDVEDSTLETGNGISSRQSLEDGIEGGCPYEFALEEVQSSEPSGESLSSASFPPSGNSGPDHENLAFVHDEDSGNASQDSVAGEEEQEQGSAAADRLNCQASDTAAVAGRSDAAIFESGGSQSKSSGEPGGGGRKGDPLPGGSQGKASASSDDAHGTSSSEGSSDALHGLSRNYMRLTSHAGSRQAGAVSEDVPAKHSVDNRAEVDDKHLQLKNVRTSCPDDTFCNDIDVETTF